ncbi:AAA family ATPase [Synechococcus sp. CCAP 1479/9]|uniref:AAA family ATPase n=1 Tax=Synechococcus sp. CCAP 1479/9 TaxID=1221593 RepID=UPI001C243121
MSDLFWHQGEQARRRIAPLADRLRPRSLDDFVGQAAILGPGRLLRRAIAADRVGNLILHGPPGTGKTTLARIIAGSTRAHFSSLNAVLAGVKDLRAEVDAAKQRLEHHGLRTILFIDEVHRFNSAQQDALLPWVENGTVTLIGATTENPYFEVNKALVSRSRLFRLQPLEPEDLRLLLQRALADPEHGYGQRHVELSEEAGAHLLDVAGGDARSLLNALELAVETTEADAGGVIRIDLAIAEESIQQRAVLYDKQGDAHFDTISAFIKSIRGSDPDAALFWLARMVEAGENPRFILRRLLISAGEDIGLADPQAMVVVEACAAAFDRVGLPEGLYPLAHATLYLAGTEKSNSSLGFFDAVKAVREARRQQVPAHLRDANRDGEAFGDGVGYRYPHAYADHWVAQQYLPQSLQGEVFWQPGALGWEGGLRKRLQQRRAAQLAAAAETAADDRGDLLSSSPDDPLLNRWLQRQAGAEGERLDRLRRRFWEDAAIGRLDRVLVLEAHSLLWALDPLEAASEGEVVLATPSAAVLDRLQAQLQLLDQLRRPRLLAAAPETPDPLRAQLEPWPQAEGRFEWIAARQPWRGCSPEQRRTWLELLTDLAAPGARAQLLFTHPLLGPAGSLRALVGRSASGATPAVLETAAELEREWLAAVADQADHVQEGLESLGWSVQRRVWEEALELPLGDALLERWFGKGASYRKQLTPALAAAGRKTLEALFRERRGTALPQPLGHTLLLARRGAGP